MHQAFTHLAKRVADVSKALLEVSQELQNQLERENKTLEEAEYGDAFDEELAPIQEKVVAALQESLEELDDAERLLASTEVRLKDIQHF